MTKLSKLGKSSGFFFVQQFRMEALRDLWTGAGLNAIEGWHYGLILAAFIRHLVDRGLNGVRLIMSDACRGLTESAADYLPQARWRRCMVHFYRNVFSHVPATKIREVSHMVKSIHAQETRTPPIRRPERSSTTGGPAR